MNKILMLLVFVFLTGCVSFNRNDSRYIGTAMNDNAIALAVNDKLFKEDHTYFGDVNVTVFGARVMLVGDVANNYARSEVINLVATTPGVRQVLDYVMLKGNELGQTGFSWFIHKKIVAKLLANKNISSNNFKVVVYRKIAYVIGEAETSGEKNLVLDTIRNTDGVLSVMDNIIVK